MHDETAAEAPLAGIRVVEMTMYVQGPTSGLTLASLGADVVKIEQVGQADYMRSFTSLFGVTFDERGQEWLYASLNRNKRSLVLDIASEAGRPVFERLISQADAFITNLRTAGLARYGADPETLLGLNPQLVYCRGGGFGLRGELAEDLCQDTVGMAHAGFMDAISSTDVPTYPPGALSDILTGTNMASAVMAGLIKRARTGRGCVVGTSQTQALLWLTSQAVGVAANVGQRMDRFDVTGAWNPLFTVYETADGWIAIAVLQEAQWQGLAPAVGIESWLDDPRFATFEDVVANRAEFTPLFAAHMRTDTTEVWWRAIRGCGAWVSPVNRVEDLADNPDILANEYLVTYDDGFIGPPAMLEVDEFRGARGGTADYGEHTDEVLTELGRSGADIAELRNDGIIA
ncbi:CaiB/BaiF CoA transferase family protein [Candidatus Poriferisodalis sp.]|uniref:CaiB/BaiF CoA transferase family protein n=1 Tax=Candidatus Poriferisodalis sp. TaxID=3101277 RepID=UPI003AF97A92